ncbi:SUMO-activating enzyme subunit 1-like [Saccoglossus kowalevskii]
MLLVGLKGVGAEVCKNVVLCGLKSLTLLDHSVVSDEDAFSQFLVCRTSVGKNRAEASVQRSAELNPNVKIIADTDNVENKPDEFFTTFDLVCVTCCNLQTMLRINDICRQNKIKFLATDVFGYYGYMFSDLVDHEFVEEKAMVMKKDDEETKKTKVEKTETLTVKGSTKFCSLKDALNVDWKSEKLHKSLKKLSSVYFIMQVLLRFRGEIGRDPDREHLEDDCSKLLKIRDQIMEKIGVPKDKVGDDFASVCAGELGPVCAVVGGIVGQEVIKAVSGKDAPHNNFFFFNGTESSGIVDQIGTC